MARPMVERMEERILHSASGLLGGLSEGPTLGNAWAPAPETALMWVLPAATSTSAQATSAPATQGAATHTTAQRQEIVFVDASLPDAQLLLADINADGLTREIVWITPGSDGLALISHTLAGRQGVDALHLITHGSAGSVQLGSTTLDSASLMRHAGAVAAWAEALSEQADLLIYGCDVAAGAAGAQLLLDLAQLTGADVAASTDPTGNAALGGNWRLEQSSGPIETTVAIGPYGQQNWLGTLALFTADPNVADGAVNSLRWALNQANLTPGIDTIQLLAGTHNLTLLNAVGTESLNASGDLDVLEGVNFVGASSNALLTVVNMAANVSDRVFDVLTGSSSFQNLTIQGGRGVSQGGGINVTNAGTATLTNVVVRDNAANNGAGIYSVGSVTLNQVTVSGNVASTTGGGINNRGNATLTDVWLSNNQANNGGGLSVQGGTASTTLNRVTISTNSAIGSGGGIYGLGGSFSGSNVTVTGNTAANGAGLFINTAGWSLSNSTIAGNSASAAGGGVYTTLTLNLKNSILASNTGGNSLLPLTSQGYNIDTDNTAGLNGPTDLKPTVAAVKLQALAANGGYTPTMALLAGSVAINVGDPGAPAADQRGVLRAGVADIGAYEYSTAALNAAPVNTLPAAPIIYEDKLTLITGVSVADPDAGGATASWKLASTQLSVSNGSLSLTLSGAASFSAGANNSASFTVSGSQTDINASLATLSYTGAANYNGPDSLVMFSQDGLGLSDLDSLALTVLPVNDAPRGANNTLNLVEGGSLVLGRADFGFVDAPGETDSFISVLLQLPSGGALKLNNVTLTTATEVTVADLDAGKLVFVASDPGSGSPYATLTFQVRDSGGTANGGVNLDPTPRTLGFNVISANTSGAQLWFTTAGAVVSAGGIGWSAGQIAQFGDAGDSFDINGGTTAGTISLLPGFTAPATIRGLHYVQTGITLGTTGPKFTLNPGDLVMVLDPGGSPATVTLNLGDGNPGNDIVAERRDVVVFRPATFNNYASGTWHMLLDNAIGSTPYNVHALSIVESDTTVGGTLLTAGTLVLSHSDTSLHKKIYTTTVIGTGVGTSSTATTQMLIDGSKLGLPSDQFQGLHLLTQAASFNGTTLAAGTLLVAIKGSNTFAGVPQDPFDIVALTVTRTERNGGTLGTGQLLFDGSDIGLTAASDPAAININGFTVVGGAAANSAPVFTSPSSANVPENTTAVLTLTATDAELQTVSFSIAGGADSALFTLFGGNQLRFINAPDREAPSDANGDNVYEVLLRATDSGGANSVQAIAITVANVNEPPTVALPLADQNATQDTVFGYTVPAGSFVDVDAGDVLSYGAKLSSGAALPSWLSFNTSTRTFSGTPLNADVGSFTVRVTATDTGSLSVYADFVVTVANVNDAPTVATPIPNQNATEHTAFSFTFNAATFVDIDGDVLLYAASRAPNLALPGWLSFNASTRTFSGTPQQADVGTVTLRVTATDPFDATAYSDFTLTVINVNDAPVITSQGGVANAVASVRENTTAVATVTATDPDGDLLTYSIVTGGDSARFTINASTGVLSFITAPDFENPLDMGADNVYNVTVRVSDGALSATQNWAVTVTDVSSALVVTTTADTVDGDTSSPEALNANPGTDGVISLREAVLAANNVAGANTISLPAGTFTLTRAGLNETAGLTGDLNLKGTLSIQGAGMGLSIVNGNGLDRVFDLRAGAVVTMSDLSITGGDSRNNWGGGINAEFAGSSLTLNRVNVTGNTGSFGAGVYVFKSTLQIFDSTLDGNTGVSGAGLYNDGGTVTLNRVTVSGNTATNDGAGLYNATVGATLSLVNTTLSGNVAAGMGGGLFTKRDVTMLNSTVADNSASAGGGIFIGNPGSLTLQNTIVANNAGGNANVAVISAGHNIDSDNSLGLNQTGDLINTDPMLGPLQDNGGATLTRALLAGSPALNAGNTAAAPVSDQRGGARNGAADIGAFEAGGALNVRPVNNLPGPLMATEDTWLAITGLSVSDADLGKGISSQELVSTSLAVDKGRLQVSLSGGVSIGAGANGSANFTLLGNEAGINATLATLMYLGNSNYAGADSLRIVSRDGEGLEASDSLAIWVDNVNDPPTVAHAIGNQTAVEDQAFGFSFSATTFVDVDAGDTLSYGATLASGAALPGWLSFNAATRSFSGTPLNADVGLLHVRVTATDQALASAWSDFVLTVNNVNDAPTVVTGLADQLATQDQAFSFVVPGNSFADEDVGDTLSYSARLASGATLPGWLSFDAATSSFSGTPRNAHVGSFNVRVTATDKAGASAWSDFILTVSNVNDAPTVVTPLPNQLATQDQIFSFVVPGNSFADVDVGDKLSYSAKLASGAALPGWLSFDANTRSFSGTPRNADVGSFNVRVTATDQALASAWSDFVLTVNNVNDAPTLVAALTDQLATQDQAFSFVVPDGSFADIDAGDALSYSAMLPNGSALPSWLRFDAATRAFSGTPTSADVGRFNVRVTATDLAGASAWGHFALTVNNVNDAPTLATALADQLAVQDQAFSFVVPDDSFADVDADDRLSYSATLASGAALPGWLHFDPNTRSFSGTPANADVGSFHVRVTATDLSWASVADDFELTVLNVNDAPLLTAALPDQTATQDINFSLNLPPDLFVDIDLGDTLRLSAARSDGAPLPAWLQFDGQRFSGTPGNSDVGSLVLRITATDLADASAWTDFTLVVANVNDAPQLAMAVADSLFADGQAFSFAVPSGTFVDPDVGDTLRLSARLVDGSSLPAWLQFDADSASFSGRAAGVGPARFEIQLTASDSAGATAQTVFALLVLAPPPAPPPASPPSPPPAPPAAAVPIVATAPVIETSTAAPKAQPTEPPAPPKADTPVTSEAAPATPASDIVVASTWLAPAAALPLTSTVTASPDPFPSAASSTPTRFAPTPVPDAVEAAAAPVLAQLPQLALSMTLDLSTTETLSRSFESMERQLLDEGRSRSTTAVSTAAVTGGLSVGYVVWLVRGGVLMSSMLSALPVWQMVDPMPVLASQRRSREDGASDDDLERLFDGQDPTDDKPQPAPARTPRGMTAPRPEFQRGQP